MKLAALVAAASVPLLAAGAAPARAPAAAPETPDPQQPKLALFLFNLSDFLGDVKGSFQRVAYDRAHAEAYVWGGRDIQVFGGSGMQIYSFGSAQGLHSVYSIAPLPSGDLIVSQIGPSGPEIVRCNYRGEVTGPFTPTALPPGVTLGYDEIRYADGKLWFLTQGAYRVVATDEDGRYLFTRDLTKAISAGMEADQEPDTSEVEITGFDVDEQGNVLVTIAAQFRAISVSPDGVGHPFGGKGSRPGKFNVAGPIARDERGYYFVADTLRSVVMVFAPDLKFLFEFGGRGETPGHLVIPSSIAVGNGMVFVSQARNRGVSVFRLQ
ncbi:MAG TPA: hypothetical protein VF841_10830 [Anaeromyxobacter sp.]